MCGGRDVVLLLHLTVRTPFVRHVPIFPQLCEEPRSEGPSVLRYEVPTQTPGPFLNLPTATSPLSSTWTRLRSRFSEERPTVPGSVNDLVLVKDLCQDGRTRWKGSLSEFGKANSV